MVRKNIIIPILWVKRVAEFLMSSEKTKDSYPSRVNVEVCNFVLFQHNRRPADLPSLWPAI